MSKTILVAGGAGYIGSHFCKLAAQKGYTTVTLDRLVGASPELEQFRKQSVQWGPLEVADIGDAETVLAILQKYKPIAAICFASLIDAAESVTHPDMYWDNNFYKTMRFFKTLEHGDVHHVVYSSTAAVYGNTASDKPILEDSALSPTTPYGMTKLACEIALHGLYARQEASDEFIDEFARRCLKLEPTYPEFRVSFFPCLKSIVFRYFNAAGADASCTIGEMHEPETHLIPNAIFAAHGKKSFTLHGADYSTMDGSCVRDYIHVEDLAQAHLLGLEHLLKTDKSDVFNLGSGAGSSVREVITAVQNVTGKTFNVTESSRRNGDTAYLVADVHKAQEILGWKAMHDLKSMIKSAAAFYQRKT